MIFGPDSIKTNGMGKHSELYHILCEDGELFPNAQFHVPKRRVVIEGYNNDVLVGCSEKDGLFSYIFLIFILSVEQLGR